MIIISAYTAVYYNVIIAWSVRYLVASFTTDLPWLGCHHAWTKNDLSCATFIYSVDFSIAAGCFDASVHEQCKENNTVYVLGECRAENDILKLSNGTSMSVGEINTWHFADDDHRVSPSQLYKCALIT
jgi:hypothetical protein